MCKKGEKKDCVTRDFVRITIGVLAIIWLVPREGGCCVISVELAVIRASVLVATAANNAVVGLLSTYSVLEIDATTCFMFSGFPYAKLVFQESLRLYS